MTVASRNCSVCGKPVEDQDRILLGVIYGEAPCHPECERWLRGEVFKNRPIAEMDLSMRSVNVLLRTGIQTVGDLYGGSAEDLGAIGVGAKSLAEMRSRLGWLDLPVLL